MELVDTSLLWGFGVAMEEEGGGGGEPDLISALPEDLLLQVLVRLRCAAAAARTSLLSRRWRGLWTRLPDLVFRDATVRSIEAALSSLQAEVVSSGVSLGLLDIRFHRQVKPTAHVSSLLQAAVGLSPMDFSFTLSNTMYSMDVDLPPYHRATSIKLHVKRLGRLRLPPAASGTFHALERLSLSGFSLADLAALVLLCPCLRVLRASDAFFYNAICFQSQSLQELFVSTDIRSTHCINIEAPILKQLALLFGSTSNRGRGELSVSILAPIVKEVSWECSFSRCTTMTSGFGPWGLSKVSLHTGCSQLSNVNVLSLQMVSCGSIIYPDIGIKFGQMIDKHLFTDFSVLELHFIPTGLEFKMRSVEHVFGACVLHLLGIHRVRTSVQMLKIVILRSEVKKECPENCPCDAPKSWRSKNIPLINLEEVEIKGFQGEDHELDFLRLIFRCAPMLKRIAVRTPFDVMTSNDRNTKIHQVLGEYPFVECKLMQH